jgi:excisionase family DNA binding protein
VSDDGKKRPLSPLGKADLTTEQAADTLNVSVEYLARLLDEGRIPFREQGGYRLLGREDLLAFKRERDRDRQNALDDLAQISQDLGGYEELSEGD